MGQTHVIGHGNGLLVADNHVLGEGSFSRDCRDPVTDGEPRALTGFDDDAGCFGAEDEGKFVLGLVHATGLQQLWEGHACVGDLDEDFSGSRTRTVHLGDLQRPGVRSTRQREWLS